MLVQSCVCPSLSLKGKSSNIESQVVIEADRIKTISCCTELPVLPHAERGAFILKYFRVQPEQSGEKLKLIKVSLCAIFQTS